MKQNILIDTKDGKINIKFERCITCKSYNFCYLDSDGLHHNGTPKGISEECLNKNL